MSEKAMMNSENNAVGQEDVFRPLIKYCGENPGLEPQDLFKFIYQSCFGCEHLLTDGEKALQWILEEMKEAAADDLPAVELLDGDFCRVHLKALRNEADAEKLCELFVRSAKKQENGRARLLARVNGLPVLAEAGELPFEKETLIKSLDVWRAADFPPVHHSASFNAQHHPAYRVIRRDFLPACPFSGQR